MRYKLERSKEASLVITKDDKKQAVKVFGKSNVRIGAWKDLRTARAVPGLNEKEQAYFEKELGMEKGQLAHTSKFWNTWGVPFDSQGAVLDDDIIEEKFAITVLSRRPDVAMSSADAKKDAKVEYTLRSDESEAEATVGSRDTRIKALVMFNEMSTEQMREYLVTSGTNPVNMSDKVVRNKVGETAELKPDAFLALAENPNKKELLFLNELVNHALMKKHGKQFLDTSNNVIAFSEQEMINWVKNPENSQIVAGYRKQLAVAKKEK